MPTVIKREILAYTFDELDESAKQKAREDYLEHFEFFPDFVIEDFVNLASLMGFEIETRPVRTLGGGSTDAPCVYWQLFCQGQGACFEGRYSYTRGSVKAIRDYAPYELALHNIAEDLRDLQRRHFYGISARIRHSSNHCHERSMKADVEFDTENGSLESELEFVEIVVRLAKWLFRQIMTEYEYQTSDERIDSIFGAAGMRFDQDGNVLDPREF